MLRRNVLANYLGQACISFVGFVFIPQYIAHLGMEAYALIGFFATIQAWMALFDMGMAPTIQREMARYSAGAHSAKAMHDLLHSIELVSIVVAVAAGLGVWGASTYLSEYWLRPETLQAGDISNSITMMGLVIAMRLWEGIYKGVLFGLQRQVLYNMLNALLTVARHTGALLVLIFIRPTIEIFFAWQVFISLVSLATFRFIVPTLLPKTTYPVQFTIQGLKSIRAFAGGMLGVGIASLLLTQVDKLLLSTLLRLEDFGFYSLAVSLSGLVLMVVGPILAAVYPRLIELTTSHESAALTEVYHLGSQAIAAVATPVCVVLCLFPQESVFAWTGSVPVAKSVAGILRVFSIGTFFNALLLLPNRCQWAHGWTKLSLQTHLAAAGLIAPALFWIVPRAGALGAAWTWLVLNLTSIFVVVPLMHRRILAGHATRWFLADTLMPVASGLIVGLAFYFAWPREGATRLELTFLVVIAGSASAVAALAGSDTLRPRIFAAYRKLLGAT